MHKNIINQILEDHKILAGEVEISHICSDIRFEIDRVIEKFNITYFKTHEKPDGLSQYVEKLKLELNVEICRPGSHE